MPQTPEQTVVEFEKLFSRPRFYFHTSAERQWEIDKELGILDVEVDSNNLTQAMISRYSEYFK
jgi:hypothetical protein